MGPYVATNAVLIGVFGFAAIYHVVLWSQSRRDAVLVIFAVHCVLCALGSADLMALVGAQTVPDGQFALDWRLNLSALAQISAVWLLSLIAGVRARWFVWFMTAFFVTLAITNISIVPLAGTVTGVERITMPWGEHVSMLQRGSPSRLLAPMYVLSLSVTVFGFVCAARLWARDRVGGTLFGLASAGMLAGNVLGALIDASGVQGLYVGSTPYAVWVLLLSIEIAREIHDVLGQALTALKMDVAWIGARSPVDAPPAFRQKLVTMAGLIDESVVTVRRIATNLRPGVLDDLGLAAAIEWQAREFENRTGIHCPLRASIDEEVLDPLLSTALFRIFQEALTNVTRHSRASKVSVTLEHSGADLVLEVQDDGVGITPAESASTPSIGLTGMRERAQLVGGRVFITGAPGVGTTVLAQVPLRNPIAKPAGASVAPRLDRAV